MNNLQFTLFVILLRQINTCSFFLLDCMSMIEQKYKFYLSFENSFCKDYITEKFWKVLSFNVIPIVMGSGNYSKYAPAKSFINVEDFNSGKELADYLTYLNSNATAYAEYFEWKNYFKVSFEYNRAFCGLCKALNEPHEFADKVNENTFDWWRTQGQCVKKGSFPWSVIE